MPLDPVLATDVREWLHKASIDLRAAKVDLSASPPLIEDALFHCQQAVEKSFKAFLTLHAQPFRKTHSLEELGEACLKLDAELKSFVDAAVPFTEYAWSLRYPGPIDKPKRSEAEAILKVAQSVVREIKKRVPPEARSRRR